MARAIYQVRLVLKPEFEDEFNAWYEGVYIPKLMAEVPHFTACSRSVGDWNGQRLYLTDYHTTTDDMPLAIAEMRVPGRTAINAEFYAWKDKAITLHESIQFHERVHLP